MLLAVLAVGGALADECGAQGAEVHLRVQPERVAGEAVAGGGQLGAQPALGLLIDRCFFR